LLGASRGEVTRGEDYIDTQVHKFGRQVRQPLVPLLCKSILDGHIMAINVTNLAEPLSKCLGEMLTACSPGTCTQPTHAGQPSNGLLRTTARLLRPSTERRGEEHRTRAPEERPA
jgi:hypothetical protein